MSKHVAVTRAVLAREAWRELRIQTKEVSTAEYARYAAILVRSATAPETIVADVAANANSNSQKLKWYCSSLKFARAKYVLPMNGLPPLALPYAKAKPTAQNAMAPTQASNTFLRRMFFVFFARTRPAVSMAKPVCIKKTSIAVRSVHVSSTAQRREARAEHRGDV